jgi:hypothetical protein
MIKAGQKVRIKDLSYSKVFVDGRFESTESSLLSHEYVVIMTDCVFPNAHYYQRLRCQFNNTMIQSCTDDKIVFIEARFLKPAAHTIVIDGKSIELSDKSFTNLKRQLFNE